MEDNKLVKKHHQRKPCRPHVKIDWKIVDEMLLSCEYGSTIAARLGICADTLYLRCLKEKKMTFSAYAQQRKAIGDDMLRKVQFNKAMNGDNTMLVWLGKNRLKQTDKIEQKVDQKLETIQKIVLKLPDNGRR